MKPVEQLINLLKKDKVIPVVGAGFSYAVANLPGWKGVIEHGLSYAKERQLAPASQIADVQSLLNNHQLVQGAAIMKQILNAPNHPFPGWLEELFGNPAIATDELIHSVNDLCTDYILTTNYDRLLYSQSKLKTKQVFNWSNHEEAAKALAKKEEFILHLHGVYDKPSSIILSEYDYEHLSQQHGYKTILQKLWTEYHFLFIGCSRDGVMDEDFSTVIRFLQNWFPSVNHTHFILFHDSEFAKGTQIELLTQCNIQAISYGNDYKKLAAFINNINPNKDKLIRKTENLKQELEATMKRLLIQTDGTFTNNLALVESTLQQTLPPKHYWIDSVQLQVLEKVLVEHNDKIKSKREQFRNYQLVIKAMVSFNDLKEQVNFWSDNKHNVLKLNNDAFTDLAIRSYECLQRLPGYLAEEIRNRTNAIHSYYFTGHLGNFIDTIKFAKKRRAGTILSADQHTFENLYRVINSLKELIQLDPAKVFPELKEASLTPELESPFLVLISNNIIRITKPEFPFVTVASLYADEALDFDNAEVVHYNNSYLVLAHNSQHCLRWNPEKDIAPEIFYSATPGSIIWSLHVIESADNSLSLLVNENNSLITIKDFEQEKKVPVNVELMSYTYFNKSNRLLAVKNLGINIQGAVMYHVSENGDCHPLFTKIDLWNLVKEIPELQNAIRIDMATEPEDDETNVFGYPFVRDIKLTTGQLNNKQIALLNFELSFMHGGYTVLLGLDISATAPIPIFKILLNRKYCIASALVARANQTDLLCGYLSIGNVTNMLEYIPAIESKKITVSNDQIAALPRFQEGSSDIYQVLILNQNRALALQEGKYIYDIQLPRLTYSMQMTEDVKRIIAVGNFR
jgi:hypothetical protein